MKGRHVDQHEQTLAKHVTQRRKKRTFAPNAKRPQQHERPASGEQQKNDFQEVICHANNPTKDEVSICRKVLCRLHRAEPRSAASNVGFHAKDFLWLISFRASKSEGLKR